MIDGAWEFTPAQHSDERGVFLNPYLAEEVAQAVGHPLTVAQTNHSVSRRGTLRGIHFAAVPPGQAKYVYCPRGAALDVVVDIRTGSPTFGQHDCVLLDTVDYRAIYAAEGLGHAVIALEDDTAVSYLCSTGYDPGREHGVTALDPDLGLRIPPDLDLVISDRDRTAPTLAEAQAAGLLPAYAACLAFYDTLRDRS
jgi:5-epimerase